MKAPFPYAGGKAKWAATIWIYFGRPTVYAEPFAGSIACLLSRPDPPARREIICDTEGGVVNFWRAVRKDPDTVARWADCPTWHDELLARKAWFYAWSDAHSEQLAADMDYCCPKAAGIWAWCHSVSFMGLFQNRADKSVPLVQAVGGHASGVSRGTQLHRNLVGHMRSLGERLEDVIVLNASWEAAVTPAKLARNAKWSVVAVLMDPPFAHPEGIRYYRDQERKASDDAYEWSLEHGEDDRIGFCCNVGDYPVPPGWTAETRDFQRGSARGARDQIMFSPACLAQATLFEEVTTV